MYRVEIKIVQPLKIEWDCPKCHHKNTKHLYIFTGCARVQCDFCGDEYLTCESTSGLESTTNRET